MKKKTDDLDSTILKIIKYCKENEIDLVYPNKRLSMCSACEQYGNTILLGRYSRADVQLAAFCHEVGHVQLEKSRKFRKEMYSIPMIQVEIMAWDLGLEIFRKVFKMSINNYIYSYMKDCLDNYAQYPSSFKPRRKRRSRK